MSDCSTLWSLPAWSATRAQGTDHITMLLATFNGAAHIGAQLESFCAQTHKDWSLLASDDGSTDDTCEIIRQFARQHPERRITLLRGPGKGSAINFLSLLRAAGSSPYVAFSDQDDVWYPDKLARALTALKQCSGAGLYGGRTTIADENLRPLRTSLMFRRVAVARSASSSLIQHLFDHRY